MKSTGRISRENLWIADRTEKGVDEPVFRKIIRIRQEKLEWLRGHP